MKVIVRPRQMGKTTELLKYAAENDLVIVTHTVDYAKQLDKQATRAGLIMRPPIAASMLMNDMKCNDVKGVVIDNVELVLSVLMHNISPIYGMTVSGVPELDYDERKDHEQFEDFKKGNPDLTWQQFCSFKYNMTLDD